MSIPIQTRNNLNEEKFFKLLKTFLIELKTKHVEVDVARLYYTLVNSKEKIHEILETYTDDGQFSYEVDQSELKCSDGTLTISPNRSYASYDILLTYYGDYKLTITKNDEIVSDFIEFDEHDENIISTLGLEWDYDNRQIQKANLISKLRETNLILKQANIDRYKLIKDIQMLEAV